MKKINSEEAYNSALNKVYAIMQKGEKNLTDSDAESISVMSEAIVEYEKIHYPFPLPKTIGEILEMKMFEKKMNQTELAKVLGIGTPKLSQILNNKREPDVPFLKAVHQKLGVDGNFLLKRV